jgi:hypothetical protein
VKSDAKNGDQNEFAGEVTVQWSAIQELLPPELACGINRRKKIGR